ncbi:MAG: hypothetical protein H6Q14_1548 [Bacteroidetes bacterium]|nr:hypothetical protein [Bacteroidota bacterium]
MPNFQLYKQRRFNDFLNDTTQFFRQFGKDYFKKFFLINGGIILLVCVLFYFAMRYFLVNWPFGKLHQDVASEIGGGWLSVVVLVLLALAIGFTYTVFSFGLPNVYFDNLAGNEANEEISPSLILKGIGDIAGDLLLFLVISIFTFLPIYILLAIVSKFLMPFVIGYFILVLGVCFILTWFNLSLIIYLRDYYSGYFESLGNAWNMIIRNFGHIIGANAVLFVILYILQMLVTLLPTLIATVFYIASGKNSFADHFPPLLSMVYILIIISASFLNNVFFVQQFLIYFSSVEKTENIQAISDLDLIGEHED